MDMNPPLLRIEQCSDCRNLVKFEDGARACVTTAVTFYLEEEDAVPPKQCPLRKKSRFTTEQLRNAHTFQFVEDETDQLSVCETARRLFEALPIKDDFDLIEHLLEDYINKGDNYMADELIRIYEDTIWEGKI